VTGESACFPRISRLGRLDGSMSFRGESDYVTARMTLRPPRVVVVFDGGNEWHYWVRLAIYAVSQVWGGAGFILIPHRDGEESFDVLKPSKSQATTPTMLPQPLNPWCCVQAGRQLQDTMTRVKSI
jgi:hypothetical protein